MHGEEQKFVQEAFDTNWIAPLGPNVNGFEREMEAYTGIAHCSALSAGTAALPLARYRDMSFTDFCCNSESSRL